MKFLFLIAIVVNSFHLNAQDDFCLFLTDFIKIENTEDIPVISDNGDGTITLTHPDQDITDLFAAYTIFGLEQAYPSSTNQELLKYYYLTHSSRSLIVDIQDNISEDVYNLEGNYTSEFPFDDGFLEFIDGKQYIYSARGESSDEGGNCDNIFFCDLNSISNATNLSVEFNYDSVNETLYVETTLPSSCGNEFKIGFKPGVNENNGGNSAGSIQEWSIDNVVSSSANTDDDCYFPETFLYNFLGVGCEEGFYYGNISLFYSPGQEKIRFFRENALFSTSIVEFRDSELGIDESSSNEITLVQRKGMEHIEIINGLHQNLSGVVYDTNGKVVLNMITIEDHVIDISTLVLNQLYIIELETEDLQRKLIKFIKR